MTDNTRATRTYDASARRTRAAQNHARIIAAAAALFLERGYAGTTVPAIAAHAGVAVETVYRAAPGKSGLLAAAVRSAVAGGAERAALPVEEREGIRRVINEPDPRRQLHAYAATQPGVWSRVGPLLRVLDEAAPADPELAALRTENEAQRYSGLRRFAELLADRGALRDGITVDRAADIIWTLCAQATFEALVTTRGWSHVQYREWLGDVLADALLDGGSHG
ncbi:helix-turn-helix transcriptional regulator [Microbacteriaceae bacterium VKM Ac-2854]|nr:helix-turn-helix transcriptional regulator [Microbacteriaceae bacterium VKM Ac-2854]